MQHIHLNTEQNTEQKTKQYAAQRTRHRTQNTEYTENNTENTDTNNPAQPQRTDTTQSYTYSLDYYNEFAYIKNSNTIELYTISKENVYKTLIA